MSPSLVIDTNVLSYAAGAHGDEDVTSKCVEIVFGIINNSNLSFALDTNGKILDEYKRNLDGYRNPHTQLIQKYFQKQLRERDGISHKIPLDESDVETLKENGFHDDDLIFVRVAPRTEYQCIASYDSNSLLDEDYREWIENQLEVSVHSPGEFRDYVNEL